MKWHPHSYKDKTQRRVSLLDLVVLIYNNWAGAASIKVGWNDANKSLQQMQQDLSYNKAPVRVIDLESSLYNCNLLSDEGKFWHPAGFTFEQFLRQLVPGEDFDRVYNYLIEREKPNES